MKLWCLRPLLCTSFWAKLGQADAGDNEAKLMTKLAPEWVRTSDPVISPARYRWTTAPALLSQSDESPEQNDTTREGWWGAWGLSKPVDYYPDYL